VHKITAVGPQLVDNRFTYTQVRRLQGFGNRNLMGRIAEIEFKSLVVTDPRQLDELLCTIHDEFFELDEVRYDRDRAMLDIPYRRVFHDGPARTVRQWIIYTVREKDVIRSRFRIHNVEEYEEQDIARINTYSFNTLKYDPDTSEITVWCDPKLRLRVRVSEFKIESQDLEVNGKSRISYLFFVIESYSGKVYDAQYSA
jgi:hypothetical protein